MFVFVGVRFGWRLGGLRLCGGGDALGLGESYEAVELMIDLDEVSAFGLIPYEAVGRWEARAEGEIIIQRDDHGISLDGFPEGVGERFIGAPVLRMMMVGDLLVIA